MTQEIKHTPLPYAAKLIKTGLSEPCIKIQGADKQTCVALVTWGADNEAENKASAEFIVRACNSHYELLKRLKDTDLMLGRIMQKLPKSEQALFSLAQNERVDNKEAIVKAEAK